MGRRAGPRVEAGPFSQETRQHLCGLRKKTHPVIVLIVRRTKHEGIHLSSTYNLLWCQWSRDCHIAAQQASVAPAVGEMGPEGMARGSVAPAAALHRHPELQLPAVSDWT